MAEFDPPDLQVALRPNEDPRRPWVTLVPHSFTHGPIHLRVPAGFRTDFTSHPVWLGKTLLAASLLLYWLPGLVWVLYPIALVTVLLRDPHGIHQRAALFHDRGYDESDPKYQLPRNMVDSAYRLIMQSDHVHPLRVQLHYMAVRLFGWLHFRRTE